MGNEPPPFGGPSTPQGPVGGYNDNFKATTVWKPTWQRPEAERNLGNPSVPACTGVVRASSKPNQFAISYKKKDNSVQHTAVEVCNGKFVMVDTHGVRQTFDDMDGALNFLQVTKWSTYTDTM